jgi:hypothetical protein
MGPRILRRGLPENPRNYCLVLGGQESRPQGEPVDRGSQPAKETATAHDGPDVGLSTSLQGIASLMRKREPLKSPVRETRTPGSVRGPLGNWRSYRDRQCPRLPKTRRASEENTP